MSIAQKIHVNQKTGTPYVMAKGQKIYLPLKPGVGKAKNYWFPTEMFDPANPSYDPQTSISMVRDPKDLNKWIAKIRFPRVRVDALQWRDAIAQAEDPIFPYRWSMQQIFQDLVLDGHVTACMDARKRLTTQKTPAWFDKNGQPLKNISDNLKFIHAQWWNDLQDYILDAEWYGYQLIALDDMINGGFPNIHVVRRQNISPDRENVTPVIAMIEGIMFNDPRHKAKPLNKQFNTIRNSITPHDPVIEFNDPANSDDETGESYYNWHIWVPTKNEFGSSKCGFGRLYRCAPYILFMRGAVGDFADFCELFTQPVRVLETDKEGDQLDKLQEAMDRFGSSNYMIHGTEDKFKFEKSSGVGESFNAYKELVTLCKKFITEITFGHEDAMSTTPGRLGAQQGMENSPIAIAKRETGNEQTKWLSSVMNDNVIPKLRVLGFKIPFDLTYGYLNNEEESAARDEQNRHNKDYTANVLTLKNAGWQVSADQIKEETGFDVTPVPAPSSTPEPDDTNFTPEIQNKLNTIYGIHG